MCFNNRCDNLIYKSDIMQKYKLFIINNVALLLFLFEKVSQFNMIVVSYVSNQCIFFLYYSETFYEKT